MIVHNQICNYCGDQIELPEECEEDAFFKKETVSSRMYAVSVDMCISPIKSYEGYRKRQTKNMHFTFCGKTCVLEYIKKALSEEGKLEQTR
jgi:hypothetical protein